MEQKSLGIEDLEKLYVQKDKTPANNYKIVLDVEVLEK
jgi:hypothetical protein